MNRATLLPVASGVVAVVVVLGAMVGVPTLIATRSATAEAAKVAELTECRYRFEAGIEVARTDTIVALTEVDGLLASALAAYAEQDTVAVGVSLTLIPDARARLATAAEQLSEATNTFEAAVTRSHTDPGGFLADCRAGGGT